MDVIIPSNFSQNHTFGTPIYPLFYEISFLLGNLL